MATIEPKLRWDSRLVIKEKGRSRGLLDTVGASTHERLWPRMDSQQRYPLDVGHSIELTNGETAVEAQESEPNQLLC